MSVPIADGSVFKGGACLSEVILEVGAYKRGTFLKEGD